ncbi:hypothetical protein D3C85_1494660 [compost metagenome]
MRRYGAMLLDAAQSYDDAAGQFWLDGIDDAESFSYQQLAKQINIDHPGSDLAVRDVVIINHQVEAAAIPGQDALIIDGTDRTDLGFRADLADLAGRTLHASADQQAGHRDVLPADAQAQHAR